MKTKDRQTVLREKTYTLNNAAELPLLEFALLEGQTWIRHAFTTRRGGVSRGEFSSLNLSFTRGDREEDVRENYRRVSEALGFPLSAFVTTDQTHTTNVRLVDEKDAGKGLTSPRDYSGIDGLITDTPGLLLATFYADCVPLYFVDKKHRAVGLSHSGWRGTADGMGRKTVEKMTEAFGTNPEDLLCAVGPSICQDCYEVGEEVADVFAARFGRRTGEILRHGKKEKYFLDLWQANRIMLEEAGVRPEHIAVTNICTACNADVLFSHRASGGRRGNLGAFLGILPEGGV